MSVLLIAPVAHVAAIPVSEANEVLTLWGHKMGPCVRPFETWAHGLFAHGEIVAVTVSAPLVSARVAGLPRTQAFELARLCASNPRLCRVMLRMWREFVFPAFCRAYGWSWAISYQDEALHNGNTYRFDGWVKLKEHARSGPDRRSGRKGRVKTVWGWTEDKVDREAMRIAP